MAFYPDELSPIDRIRKLGKQADSLPDLGPLKNRRQWKSLVLGKKDLGMNNFATIAEEKEEEISSDGSQGASADGFALNVGTVTNRKITFPKPRKYITSRVSERKEDVALRGAVDPIPFDSFGSSSRDRLDPEARASGADLSSVSCGGPKSNTSETKQFAKPQKSKDFIVPERELVQNFALSETPIETQWNEAFSEGAGPPSRSKSNREKTSLLKPDAEQGTKNKHEERGKSSGSSKSSAVADVKKTEAKGRKKKRSSERKEFVKEKEELPTTSGLEKAPGGKGKQKKSKGKALNMKDVVNVYKNLAYGSKEEIKSFVENLSFVRDGSRVESDKNLLSRMNLKALENKIKNFSKKSGKSQEPSSSQEKKPKPKVEKPAKRNRKAHIERLARHKVVKVPAVPSGDLRKNSGESVDDEKPPEEKEKRTPLKDKEPWKYVGMGSVLDKTYFVYPAYPPSVLHNRLQNATRTKKVGAKGKRKIVRKTKASASAVTSEVSERESKQKAQRESVKPGGGVRLKRPSFSGPPTNKGADRPSAVTVCTVKFRPEAGQKIVQPPADATEQSLLVYLHGTKAINVKSPYADKQFSRVKFFRKDERAMPLIKGIAQRTPPKGCQTVSVRNIKLPGKQTRLKSLDLLDFDEDIQNINDFLSGQDGADRQRTEERQGAKRSERDAGPGETPVETSPSAFRHLCRQRRTTLGLDPRLDHLHRQRHRHQRHPTSRETLSPDSIINEISKNIQHLQYLPDTEDNRKMIGEFFDELDQRIEVSRNGDLSVQKFPTTPSSDSFGRVLVLGY